MTSYEEEFLSTRQEARRLSIALLRFIQIDDPEWKNKYQKYLSLRFRPALSTLIREGDLTRIRALCSFAPVTESALNSFIDVAVQNQQEEILCLDFRVWGTREQLLALRNYMKDNHLKFGKVV